MLYFAYASNLSHGQMKERCGFVHFLKPVFLKDYKLVFDGFSEKRNGAVANIIEAEGEVVWGGLFDINQAALEVLDHWEGYPTHYKREQFRLSDIEGKSYDAVSYFRVGEKIGKPSREYLEIIIRGTEDCRLPKDYINKLKTL